MRMTDNEEFVYFYTIKYKNGLFMMGKFGINLALDQKARVNGSKI